jgi:IS30 family transposase
MPKSKNWREELEKVLDQYERGLIKGKLIQTKLASMLGVSRQTIWRDLRFRQRIETIEKSQRASNSKKTARASMEMANRELRSEIERLKHENSLLIQNMILTCRNLQEDGLDPRKYTLELASEIESTYTKIFGRVDLRN